MSSSVQPTSCWRPDRRAAGEQAGQSPCAGCRTAADLCSALAREMSSEEIAAAQREARFPHPALTWDMAAHRTNKRNPVGEHATPWGGDYAAAAAAAAAL